MSEARWITADVFEAMAGMPDGSVDLIVTSPPFLALRSYLPDGHPDKAKEIGSEATPAEFLSTLLRLTAEWRRVLAPHGSICVELGDTFAGGNGWACDDGRNPWRTVEGTTAEVRGKKPSGGGWPLAKSLCGIPDAYALSLEYGWNMLNPTEKCDRWRVRNKIVWHRPNPPVGALGDKVRPSTSYITTACVSKDRWFDLDSERSALTAHSPTIDRSSSKYHNGDDLRSGRRRLGDYDAESQSAGAPLLDCWTFDEPPPIEPKSNTHRRTAKGVDSVERTGKSSTRGGNWASLKELGETGGAPLLDCWTIPTQPYSGAHYATFPMELPRRLINLMCPMHVCRECGEPRRRITGEPEYVNSKTGKPATTLHFRNGQHVDGQGNTVNTDGQGDRAAMRVAPTLGWSDCGHDNYRRGIVLDPFAGSGTTLAVATGLGRDAIGIDLDSRNLELARDRIGMFLTEEVPA